MSHPRSIALLGGPESGKTTYLGALTRALREDQAGAHLRLSHLQDDETTLQALMDPLLEGRYPQRTKAERHRFRVALETRGEPEPVAFTLEAGDYDGEEIERLFRRAGAFSAEWRARASAGAVLLFLRHDAMTPLPRDLLPPPTEAERWAALRGEPGAAGVATPGAAECAPSGTDTPEGGARSGAERPASARTRRPEDVFGPGVTLHEPMAPPAQPRDQVKVPTSLALIEVLQFLRHARDLGPAERPPPGALRVAILIAAWDAVEAGIRERGPARYIAEQTPLLHDYLWSNFRDEDVCAFGLSATGGDLRSAAHRDRYLDEPEGLVVWSNAATQTTRTIKDLSLPVRWALFGERTLGEHG